MPLTCVFKRVEKKYLISARTLAEFTSRIAPYAKQDNYGRYTICNLYYDTEDDELIRASIEKPLYKEKLRLRGYGVPGENDTVFVELKKKYHGTVFKRRVALPLAAAVAYLDRDIRPAEDSQILREIDYFRSRHALLPRIYLAYDRLAYSALDRSDLRLTVDHHIRSRRDHLDLSYGDQGERLLADDAYLVEIKTGGALPLWLAAALSDLRMYPCAFSKYGNIYKNHLERERKTICLPAS